MNTNNTEMKLLKILELVRSLNCTTTHIEYGDGLLALQVDMIGEDNPELEDEDCPFFCHSEDDPDRCRFCCPACGVCLLDPEEL